MSKFAATASRSGSSKGGLQSFEREGACRPSAGSVQSVDGASQSVSATVRHSILQGLLFCLEAESVSEPLSCTRGKELHKKQNNQKGLSVVCRRFEIVDLLIPARWPSVSKKSKRVEELKEVGIKWEE
jgi:hypothetical protein